MGCSIGGLRGPREVGDGAGEEVEIIEDCWSREDESQRDAASGETRR